MHELKTRLSEQDILAMMIQVYLGVPAHEIRAHFNISWATFEKIHDRYAAVLF